MNATFPLSTAQATAMAGLMFEFAFNNPTYSDYKLRLLLSSSAEDIARTPKPSPNEEAEAEAAGEDIIRTAKAIPTEEEEDEDSSSSSSSSSSEEDDDISITPKSLPKQEDQKGEQTIEEGTPAAHADATKTCPDSLQVHGQQSNEVLHVNAAILAKESLDFRRMFDADSFKETSEKVLDVWLAPCEKEAFLDILKYLYTTELEASTLDKLSLVWKLSDRFMVDSCVNICIQRLLALPFSFESSCDILEATTNMKKTKLLKKLVNKSLSFLSDHFKDERNNSDFKQLSPEVLELLLCFDGPLVPYEERVSTMLQGWVKANCKDTESADAAWQRFGPLVRWPMMEMSFLRGCLRKHDYCKLLKDLLVEALLYHISTDEEKEAMDSIPSKSHRFRRRANSPIRLRCLPMDSFTNQELTFFAITLEDWARIEKLMPAETVYTHRFRVCGSAFQWIVKKDQYRPYLYLHKCNGPSSSMRLDISISIWDASSSAYVERWKGIWKPGETTEVFEFEKRVQKLIRDTKYVHNGATRVKADVQVHRLPHS